MFIQLIILMSHKISMNSQKYQYMSSMNNDKLIIILLKYMHIIPMLIHIESYNRIYRHCLNQYSLAEYKFDMKLNFLLSIQSITSDLS